MVKPKVNYILFLVLVIFLIYGWLNERILINDGLGWDGVDFIVSINSLESRNELGTDIYRTQRVLPFAFIWAVSKVIGVRLTNENIVSAFLGLNSLLILMSFYYWSKIVEFYGFETKIKILCFFSVFINYAILKFALYNPVLTDTLAFALGLSSFYYYIKDAYFKLLLNIVLGVFSFPMLIYVGAIFLIWPYKDQLPKTTDVKKVNYGVRYIVLLIYSCLVLLLFFVKPEMLKVPTYVNANLINYKLLPLSITFSLVYLYFVSRTLIKIDFKTIIVQVTHSKRILLAFLLILLSKILIYLLSTRVEGFGMMDFGVNILLQSLTNPLSNLVSHIMYVGPLLILGILVFPAFTRTIQKEGAGVYFFALLYFYLLLGNESRQFINAFPVLLILLFSTLKNAIPSWEFVFSCGFISLVFSRFWLPINREEFSGSYLEFPWQNYFMSQGPWMSNTMYFVFVSIIIGTCAVFYFIFKKEFGFILKVETNPPANAISS